MPIDYSKYPANWKTEIRPAILKRAKHRCEFCGVRNHVKVKNAKGKVIKIVLTISHQNHDITDNRPENLKALCQKCHLDHDREHHGKTRARNKRKTELERQPELF